MLLIDVTNTVKYIVCSYLSRNFYLSKRKVTNLNIVSCNYRNSVTCVYYFIFVDSKVAGTVRQISE